MSAVSKLESELKSETQHAECRSTPSAVGRWRRRGRPDDGSWPARSSVGRRTTRCPPGISPCAAPPTIGMSSRDSIGSTSVKDSVSMCISAGRLVARVRALLQTSLLSDTPESGTGMLQPTQFGQPYWCRRRAVRRIACIPRGRGLPGDVPRYACSVATSTSRARAFASRICRGVRQRTRMSAGLATTTARH